MIRTDKLIGIIAEKRTTQSALAQKIGITSKTFYSKMRKGVFDSDEIEILIKELGIENPTEIFFASFVT